MAAWSHKVSHSVYKHCPLGIIKIYSDTHSCYSKTLQNLSNTQVSLPSNREFIFLGYTGCHPIISYFYPHLIILEEVFPPCTWLLSFFASPESHFPELFDHKSKKKKKKKISFSSSRLQVIMAKNEKVLHSLLVPI